MYAGDIITLIMVTISCAVAGFWLSRFSKLQKKLRNQRRESLESVWQAHREQIVRDLATRTEDTQSRDEILKEFKVPLKPRAMLHDTIRREVGELKEVEDLTSTLRERIESIEKRFPEESTLEKIASVNDAILGTKVEEIQKFIDNLESKLITKWDVAKIVFTIIASLGALVSLAIAIIKFVANSA